MSKEFESSHEVFEFKFGDRVRITKYETIFSKGYTEKWSKEISEIDSALETNPWMYKVKDINREKITGSFYEKYLWLSKLKKSYYLEPDNYIRDKVKAALGLSNYATGK